MKPPSEGKKTTSKAKIKKLLSRTWYNVDNFVKHLGFEVL